MAHYAFLNENLIVIKVITGKDETELIDGLDPETWYGNNEGRVCKRTSYNGNYRYNYAGVGFTYDPIDDAFIAPPLCDHNELTLNDLKQWECSNAEHIFEIS